MVDVNSNDNINYNYINNKIDKYAKYQTLKK